VNIFARACMRVIEYCEQADNSCKRTCLSPSLQRMRHLDQARLAWLELRSQTPCEGLPASAAACLPFVLQSGKL